jgi:hypothetical protein
MLLGRMGPVDRLLAAGGKIFAAAYALCSGLVFLVPTGVVPTPVVHRFLHKSRWEAEEY